MFCKNCGTELKEDWKKCPKCGNVIEDSQKTVRIVETQNEKKKKPIFKRIWFWIVLVLAAFLIISVLSGGGDKEAELGKPITVDDVLSLTVEEGGFYNKIYPYHATDENSGIKYSGDGIMVGLYGVIENLSSKKIDVNEVCEAKLIVDEKYESDLQIWLEDEEETVFTGYNYLSDAVYLSPDAYMNPKDKFPCVLMGQVGSQVYGDAEDAILELKIMKDIDEPDKFITYKMPLTISENEEPTDEFTDVEVTKATESSKEVDTTEEETTAPPETTQAATEAPETTQAETEEPEIDYLSYDTYKASIGNGYSFGENSDAGFQILNGDGIEIGTVYIYANGAEMPYDYMDYEQIDTGSFDDYHWYEKYRTDSAYYLWVVEAHNMATTNALIYIDINYEDKITKNGFSLELY